MEMVASDASFRNLPSITFGWNTKILKDCVLRFTIFSIRLHWTIHRKLKILWSLSS
jgi:hypothetical protein